MEKYYQAADIAARYGVTMGTVYSWIRNGRLKAVRIGKRYYIKERDIKKMERTALKGTSFAPVLKSDI